MFRRRSGWTPTASPPVSKTIAGQHRPSSAPHADDRDDVSDPRSAVLVGSGTFTIDRRLALEKLKDFQLPDARLFFLSWIRAAVAGGATMIHIRERQSGYELAFDGLPFGPEELRDPYACLFEMWDPRTARNRYLAIGLLSILRLKPKGVTIGSKSNKRSVEVAIDSLEKEPKFNAQSPLMSSTRFERSDRFTVIRFVHDRFPGIDGENDLTRLNHLCAMVPIPMTVFDRKYDSFPGIEKSGAFSDESRVGDCRVWIRIPELSKEAPMTHFYTLGVWVETVSPDSTESAGAAPLPFVSYINDDQFTLNASQSAVVRNQSLQNRLRQLDRLEMDCFNRRMPAMADQMRKFGREMRTPEVLYYCKDKFGPAYDLGRAMLPDYVPGSHTGEWAVIPKKEVDGRAMAVLYRYCRLIDWFLSAAEQFLSDYSIDRSNPFKKTLWETPICLGVDGEPLSLKVIDKATGRMDEVPVSTLPILEHLLEPPTMVWLITQLEEKFLIRFFQKKSTRSSRLASKTELIFRNVRLEESPARLYQPGRRGRMRKNVSFIEPVAPSEATPPQKTADGVILPADPVSRAEPPPLQNSPPVQISAEKPAPDPVAPAGLTAVDIVQNIFEQTRVRRGLRINARAVQTIKPLAYPLRTELLPAIHYDHWTFNPAHPMIQSVLQSNLAPVSQASYLASLIYSAANRTQSDVTDDEDVAFQEALVECLTAKSIPPESQSFPPA